MNGHTVNWTADGELWLDEGDGGPILTWLTGPPSRGPEDPAASETSMPATRTGVALAESGPAAARPCCMLAPSIVPLLPGNSNFVDPTRLGVHRGRDEAVGVIYTGRAGFVDLGHLRDLCDLTKTVLDAISAANGSPSTVATSHGRAVFHASPAPNVWPELARAIAFQDSFAYELLTYDVMTPGGHNSSFSPEDLCSNLLGTTIALRAVRRGGPFDAAVTSELVTTMSALDAQTVAETRRAFDLINGRWVTFSGARSVVDSSYLRRRNFTHQQWHTGHPSDRPVPSWVTEPPIDISPYCDYEHTLRRSIPLSSFPSELARVMSDVHSRYGAGFNSP
jgi:hypothetical protein